MKLPLVFLQMSWVRSWKDFTDSWSSLTSTLHTGLSVSETVDRFRPNIVVRGIPPFLEDTARFMSIDNIRFKVGLQFVTLSANYIKSNGRQGYPADVSTSILYSLPTKAGSMCPALT